MATITSLPRAWRHRFIIEKDSTVGKLLDLSRKPQLDGPHTDPAVFEIREFGQKVIENRKKEFESLVNQYANKGLVTPFDVKAWASSDYREIEAYQRKFGFGFTPEELVEHNLAPFEEDIVDDLAEAAEEVQELNETIKECKEDIVMLTDLANNIDYITVDEVLKENPDVIDEVLGDIYGGTWSEPVEEGEEIPDEDENENENEVEVEEKEKEKEEK